MILTENLGDRFPLLKCLNFSLEKERLCLLEQQLLVVTRAAFARYDGVIIGEGGQHDAVGCFLVQVEGIASKGPIIRRRVLA